MKNGRDQKSDQKVLDWFENEKRKNSKIRINDKVELIQGCDGIFRYKVNGVFVPWKGDIQNVES
jgi:hypothetical protein